MKKGTNPAGQKSRTRTLIPAFRARLSDDKKLLMIPYLGVGEDKISKVL